MIVDNIYLLLLLLLLLFFGQQIIIIIIFIKLKTWYTIVNIRGRGMLCTLIKVLLVIGLNCFGDLCLRNVRMLIVNV